MLLWVQQKHMLISEVSFRRTLSGQNRSKTERVGQTPPPFPPILKAQGSCYCLDNRPPWEADAGVITMGGGEVRAAFQYFEFLWWLQCDATSAGELISKSLPSLTVVRAASLCAAWDVRSLLCVLWKVSLETVVSQAANPLIFCTSVSNKFKHWGVTSLLPPSCFPMRFHTALFQGQDEKLLWPW